MGRGYTKPDHFTPEQDAEYKRTAEYAAEVCQPESEPDPVDIDGSDAGPDMDRCARCGVRDIADNMNQCQRCGAILCRDCMDADAEECPACRGEEKCTNCGSTIESYSQGDGNTGHWCNECDRIFCDSCYDTNKKGCKAHRPLPHENTCCLKCTTFYDPDAKCENKCTKVKTCNNTDSRKEDCDNCLRIKRIP